MNQSSSAPASTANPHVSSCRPRRRWRRTAAGTALVAASALLLLLSPVTQTREQRDVGEVLARVSALFDHRAQPLAAKVEVLKAKGLPKALGALKADLALAAPDRMWVATTVEGQRIEAARDRQRIWFWQPDKSFGMLGEAGVPRFSTAPETSRDETRLAPLSLPIDWKTRLFLPRTLAMKSDGHEEIEGQQCRVIRGEAHTWASRLFHLPKGTMTLWLRPDGWPAKVGYREGDAVDAVVAFRGLQVGAPLPESRWELPAPAAEKVTRVALSHLTHFMGAAFQLANTKLRPLGPVRGERRLVGSHGAGRLEDHDGARVLFLRGTPEQMGEQHGALLKPQVRDLVNRVLYGVGVGSSFAKGRWFFGEIEQAQQRIGRFVDARYLREMDALAAAASLDKEEVRLANFFPELFHCSGFALMGEATDGGRIFHGRVLDYMKGVGLEANAVVIVYRPDDAHAWVNVSYAGFVGTVTAMNDQHISIGEMGGRGEGNWDGKPMAQLLREVMEKAGTLDEAIEILRKGPRTCEYFYVIADGKSHQAVGIAATPDTFEVVHPGQPHPRLQKPVKDTVLLSAGDRYEELVRRAQAGYGRFDADSARALMTRPVCMTSNIHSVLFAPDTLDFWVANADGTNVASHARYTHYNLAALLKEN